MNSIQRLTDFFAEFPGIGPRQARRFVYYLLTRNPEYIQQFTQLINELKLDIKVCDSCYRFFQDSTHYTNVSLASQTLCDICRNKNRDHSQLMVVSRDVDLDNIEKTRSFNGLYLVLGGSVPILEKNPEGRVRSNELIAKVEERAGSGVLKEIILAMNATPEGENTGDYIENLLRDLTSTYSLKISHLGKGISTGTELEYSDSETIKNALQNRQ